MTGAGTAEKCVTLEEHQCDAPFTYFIIIKDIQYIINFVCVERHCSFCLIWCGVNECLLSILRKNVTTDLVTHYIKIEPEVQVKN